MAGHEILHFAICLLSDTKNLNLSGPAHDGILLLQKHVVYLCRKHLEKRLSPWVLQPWTLQDYKYVVITVLLPLGFLHPTL